MLAPKGSWGKPEWTGNQIQKPLGEQGEPAREGVGAASASDPLSALGAWRPLGEAARAVILLDTDYTRAPVEDLSQQSVIIARNARGPLGRVTLGPRGA